MCASKIEGIVMEGKEKRFLLDVMSARLPLKLS